MVDSQKVFDNDKMKCALFIIVFGLIKDKITVACTNKRDNINMWS